MSVVSEMDDTHPKLKGFSKSDHLIEQTTISTSDNLNESLNTSYLDLDPEDNSCWATMTRLIADSVGLCCTPHRMLVTMRLLKAVTFSFLILTIIADGMYIFFVDIMSEYGDDGWRGTIVRAYGIGLSIMAVMLELDVQKMVHYFLGLKGFIPRSLLLLLIAVITNASPMHNNVGSLNGGNGQRFLEDANNYDDNAAAAYDDNNNNHDADDYYNQNKNNYNYNNNNGYYAQNDDAANYNNYNNNYNNQNYYNYQDDVANNAANYYHDDYYNANANYNGEDDFTDDAANSAASSYANPMSDVPVSAIAFQMVTSWVLALCALCYFILGLFCCDRFTSRAFMSTKDPVASTVIPQQGVRDDKSYASDNGSFVRA